MKNFFKISLLSLLMVVGMSFTGNAQDAQAKKLPVMEFEGGKTFDFGVIEQGKKVEHTFVFKNTGNAPLMIVAAHASCGCTTPDWTKDAIAPGQKGQVKVTFNGAGMGKVKKSITLTTNTAEGRDILYITAEIKEK